MIWRWGLVDISEGLGESLDPLRSFSSHLHDNHAHYDLLGENSCIWALDGPMITWLGHVHCRG